MPCESICHVHMPWERVEAEGPDYATCGGYPKQRPIDEGEALSYARRSGAREANQACYVVATLNAGRLIYWKRRPGDCPNQTSISLGPVEVASKIGSIAGNILGPIGFALFPLSIWGGISRHHKIAVAREQATLCDVSTAYNSWESQIEQGIVQNKISIADAKAAVPQVEANLMAAMQAIKKECNFACTMQMALRALNLYATEKYYDSLKQPSHIVRNLGVAALSGAGVYGVHLLAGA